MTIFHAPMWPQVNKPQTRGDRKTNRRGDNDMRRITPKRKPSSIQKLIIDNSDHDVSSNDQNDISAFQISVNAIEVNRRESETVDDKLTEMEVNKDNFEDENIINSDTTTKYQEPIFDKTTINIDRVKGNKIVNDSHKQVAATLDNLHEEDRHVKDLDYGIIKTVEQRDYNAFTNDALSIDDKYHSNDACHTMLKEHESNKSDESETQPSESKKSVFNVLTRMSSGKVSPIPTPTNSVQ